jgi:hypothetical protein
MTELLTFTPEDNEMKRLFVIAIAVATATAATAQERDAAFKKAAAHLVTAHECGKATGDAKPFDKALIVERERLTAFGYSEEKAEAAIAEIRSYLTESKPQMTAEFCKDILKMMEKG